MQKKTTDNLKLKNGAIEEPWMHPLGILSNSTLFSCRSFVLIILWAFFIAHHRKKVAVVVCHFLVLPSWLLSELLATRILKCIHILTTRRQSDTNYNGSGFHQSSTWNSDHSTWYGCGRRVLIKLVGPVYSIGRDIFHTQAVGRLHPTSHSRKKRPFSAKYSNVN